MSLREAYVGIRIMETSENYSRADASSSSIIQTHKTNEVDLYDEQTFWRPIFEHPESAWGETYHFGRVTLSEWIPRVPGLFWHAGAENIRKLSPAAIEASTRNWTQYNPEGKSQHVEGGIGTLRLPPANDGTRLITLALSYNASAGIPALVTADVWNKLSTIFSKKVEGKVVNGKGCWQPMSDMWASRFQSTRGIPRGYLIIDNPDAIRSEGRVTPTQIHPFTIMEYHSGAKELFDFVYATADTGEKRYRQGLEKFFERYKTERERYGKYLLAGDVGNPLWEADFNSPAELRRADRSAESQLSLLEKRVREHMIGKNIIDQMLEVLGETCTEVEDIRRISQDVGIQPSIWQRGGSLAELCSQFIDEVTKQNRLDQLVEAFALKYPDVMKRAEG